MSSGGLLGSGTLASPLGTGAISATINAGTQYLQNGNINPVDVGGAFATGLAGAYNGAGLLWNVGVNTVGGATTTALNNFLHGRSDSIVFGAATGGATSILGYGAGKVIYTGFISSIRPTINSGSGWADAGRWAGPSGFNLFTPNSWPVIGSSIGGSTGSAAATTTINGVLDHIGSKK